MNLRIFLFIEMNKYRIGRAFMDWSTNKLIRFKTFLLMSRFDFIIKNMRSIYESFSKVIDKKRVNYLIEKMYGDIFVGGKNEKDLVERIRVLNKDGVIAISDFAMEFISDEDAHLIPQVVQSFKNCIISTISANDRNMIAIKMSSLTTVTHLKKMNHIQFVLKVIEDEINSRQILEIDENFLEKINLSLNMHSEKRETKILTVKNLRSIIKFFESEGYFRFNIFSFILTNKSNPQNVSSLLGLIFDYTDREIESIIKKVVQMESYLSDLFNFASEKNCSLMIDAEQTYLQLYIDYCTAHYFKIHNKDGRCILLSTIQMYLVNSNKNLRLWLDFCKSNNLSVGLKIVRGAYISEEKQLSKIRDTPNPVHRGQIATNNSYNTGLEMILENYNPSSRIIIATHNLDSIALLGEKLKDLKLTRTFDHSGLIVAQLLGIGENAAWLTKSYDMTRAKYIPYGDFSILIPYLFRRAEESSLISKIKVQNKLINFEFKERVMK